MISVGVISDSHCAALKQGWDNNLKSHNKNVEFVFYAARGDLSQYLDIQAGCITTNNQKLKNSLEFTSQKILPSQIVQYDCILLYGLGFRFELFDTSSVSASLSQKIAYDIFSNTMAFQILHKIRKSNSKIPIFVGHCPFVSRETKGKETKYNKECYQKILGLFQKMLCSDKNLMAKMVEQPDETLTGDCFTKKEYSKFSRKLAVGSHIDGLLHPEHEASHMNVDFGSIWLNHFIFLLGSRP